MEDIFQQYFPLLISFSDVGQLSTTHLRSSALVWEITGDENFLNIWSWFWVRWNLEL